jgi:hypothetical protein
LATNTKKSNNKIVGAVLGNSVVASSTASNNKVLNPNASGTNALVEKIIEPPYKANQPFKTQYEVINNNFPILAGAMILNGKCIAYSQQGTKLELSKKDCMRIAKGDMPFNPYKQPNQNNQQIALNEVKK